MEDAVSGKLGHSENRRSCADLGSCATVRSPSSIQKLQVLTKLTKLLPEYRHSDRGGSVNGARLVVVSDPNRMLQRIETSSVGPDGQGCVGMVPGVQDLGPNRVPILQTRPKVESFTHTVIHVDTKGLGCEAV